MKKILVHYPPGTPFDDFVRLAFPVIKSAIAFGLMAPVAYSGGVSEKDALSRPFRLDDPDEFGASLEASRGQFDNALYCARGFWSPEPAFAGLSLGIEKSRPPAKTSLSVFVEDVAKAKTGVSVEDWARRVVIPAGLSPLVAQIGTLPEGGACVDWIVLQGDEIDIGGLDAKAGLKLLHALQGCQTAGQMLGLSGGRGAGS